MMMDNGETGPHLAGFSGGLLLSILASLQSADILETIVLASVGAVSSFAASLICREVLRWWRERSGRERGG